MSEQTYYENTSLWDARRYLGDETEQARYRTTLGMIPAEATSLLDVGAGNGAFLRLVEEERPGLKGRGVERSAGAIGQSVCAAPLQQGSIDQLPLGDAAVDVATALEVIEHLPCGVYERGLAELERVAARWLVISVPYREHRLRVRCPYCDCSFNPFYHMRRYDEEVMRGLFSGFSCVRLQTISAPEVLFEGMLRPAYRWLRARRGFFPPTALCPQCGYQRGAADVPEATARHTDSALSTGQRGRAWLPTRRYPRWIAGLYRRNQAAR